MSQNVTVGLASKGRPDVVGALLHELVTQTRLPDLVVLCSPDQSDIPEFDPADLPFPVQVIVGPSGLTTQRNAILDAVDDGAALIFFDDDFFPQRRFLEMTERLFEARPDVYIATGIVIDDGIHGPGFTVEQGLEKIHAWEADNPDPATVEETMSEVGSAYGCNMVVRVSAARQHHVRFDEHLPLYGWLEDLDFTRRLMRHGRSVKVNTLRGVHLGSKVWRQSGVRLGYSQVVNPLYLMGKGSIGPGYTAFSIGKNMVANVVKLALFEKSVDRFGRLRGNWMAWWEVVRGKGHPTRILSFR